MQQLTLSDLLRKVSAFIEFQKNFEDKEGFVYYDFGDFYPTKIDSWRGDYSHLALNFVIPNNRETSKNKPLTVKEFYNLLNSADDADFEGYKGGTYTMGDSTPIWVANWGESGHTVVCGVAQDFDDLILQTTFQRY